MRADLIGRRHEKDGGKKGGTIARIARILAALVALYLYIN